MKYWFGAILAFFVMAGAGCAVFSRAPGTVSEVPPATEAVSGLIGAVTALDAQAHTFALLLPDGSVEDVSYGAGVDLSGLKPGMLMHVDGTRERSTRVVRASTVTLEQSSGIRVTTPTANATVTSPLVAFGFAKTELGVIEWRLRDRTGAERGSGRAAVLPAAPGGFGVFRVDAFLPAMKDTTFSLELSVKAKANADAETVSVPLTLLSPETVSYNVYFPNHKQGSGRDCSLVYPVTRTVAKTSAVARAALIDLLKGPTAAERSEGYSTYLPAEADVLSLVLADRAATADFTAPIAWAAGSCQTASIRAQIAQTLMQFPSIGSVAVNVEGKPSAVLQP